MLQSITKLMTIYFKDFFASKELVEKIVVPLGDRLFTADAVAMHTLSIMCPYLCEKEKEFDYYHAETLITVLEIVIK